MKTPDQARVDVVSALQPNGALFKPSWDGMSANDADEDSGE